MKFGFGQGLIKRRFCVGQVNSIPLLLSFSRQEPQMETRIASVNDLKNKAFLTQWIETEARRGGKGGAGGSLLGFFKY